jgi:hypothetical protein
LGRVLRGKNDRSVSASGRDWIWEIRAVTWGV